MRSTDAFVGIYFKGEGVVGRLTEDWVYEYFGHLVYQWKSAINQKFEISGNVIRSVQNGSSPAGYAANFYMIKQ